eukprot:CAMPEP_0206224718 /NCGR_PEP_ID=MMETSP0047_2-20121206/7173_1 /ASSEMBLY_ACC=CAM_ASM_000192 /TAXON_ID=195065 /ORGANISM="Chroomonas mesostigmatica_cf, Strain CCMP1168" /LENGTH=885 /DNA_ID=CAMNT_0053647689 /DNA_START=105 /DNA_END=2759 /DNA_ORIENTATION=+
MSSFTHGEEDDSAYQLGKHTTSMRVRAADGVKAIGLGTLIKTSIMMKERTHALDSRKRKAKNPVALAKIAGLFRAVIWAKRRAKRARAQTEVLERFQRNAKVGQSVVVLHRGTPGSKRQLQEESARIRQRRQQLPLLIFDPFHPIRLGWDFWMLLLLFYSLLSVPVMVAFASSGETCESDLMKQPTAFYVDLTFDCMFMMDVLVSFRTAFYAGRLGAELITDWKAIALRYAKGFLIIDLASSLPYDLILLSSCDFVSRINGANRILRSPKLLKIIRLVRKCGCSVRIARLRVFLQKMRDVLHLNPGVVRLCQFIFTVVIIAHYNACVFFYLGELFLEEAKLEADTYDSLHASAVLSWTTQTTKYTISNSSATLGSNVRKEFLATQEMSIHELPPVEQYIVSLYWAVATMTTVGYGDVVPFTSTEYSYCILVKIIGGIMFSYIVGNMANIVGRIDLRYMKHKEVMESWEDFFFRENLPSELCNEIRTYTHALYVKGVRKLPEMARTQMSSSLLRDVTAHLYRQMLSRMPLLKDLSEASLTALSLALEPMQLAPGEVIYREGQYDNCMYFLSEGEVELSMVLLSQAQKRAFGAHVQIDTAVSDWVPETDSMNAAKERARIWQAGAAQVKWVGEHSAAYRFFRWTLNPKTKAYFGENVLKGDAASAERISTAVAITWATLYRLNKTSLDVLSRRFPDIKDVYRKMRYLSVTRFKMVALRVMNFQRILKDSGARLYVTAHAAINLPALDKRFGRCDAYASLSLEPGAVSKKNRTIVKYNTSFPEWNETFSFDISDTPTGAKRTLRVHVHDYTAAGEHELLGEFAIEVTEFVYKTLANKEDLTENGWFKLRIRHKGDKTWRNVRHKGKDAKVLITLRTQHAHERPKNPPP